MKEQKDLTSVPLVDLITDLTMLDQEIGMIQVQINDLYKKSIKLTEKYNDIINELHRRFPPLENDINLQPKTLRRRKTK